MIPMYNMLIPSQGRSGKSPQKTTGARDMQQSSKPAVAFAFPVP